MYACLVQNSSGAISAVHLKDWFNLYKFNNYMQLPVFGGNKGVHEVS